MVLGMLTVILDNPPCLQPADQTSIFCPRTMGPFVDFVALYDHDSKQHELPG